MKRKDKVEKEVRDAAKEILKRKIDKPEDKKDPYEYGSTIRAKRLSNEEGIFLNGRDLLAWCYTGIAEEQSKLINNPPTNPEKVGALKESIAIKKTMAQFIENFEQKFNNK